MTDWSKIDVDGALREISIAVDTEAVIYYVRIQAVTADGPGIISKKYQIVSGRRGFCSHIYYATLPMCYIVVVPLSVTLYLLDSLPLSKDSGVDNITIVIVEPKQPIRFKCVARGRPTPSVVFYWSTDDNNTRVQRSPMTIDNNRRQNLFQIETIDTITSTSKRRTLVCEAKNTDGTASDRVLIDVKSKQDYHTR